MSSNIPQVVLDLNRIVELKAEVKPKLDEIASLEKDVKAKAERYGVDYRSTEQTRTGMVLRVASVESTRMVQASLIELARSLGATDEQIEACKTTTSAWSIREVKA